MLLCSRLPKPLLPLPPTRIGGSRLVTFLAAFALLLPAMLGAQVRNDEDTGASPETLVTYPGMHSPEGVDIAATFGFYVYDPDLGISLDVVPGATVSVSFVTGNIGTEVPDREVVEKIYFSSDLIAGNADDILLATTPPHFLGSGSERSETVTTNIQIPTGLARGSYYLLVVADADHAVAETKENNNHDFVGFTVLGGDDGADLRIQKVLSATPVPAPGRCGFPNEPPCDVCGGEGELPCVYESFSRLPQRCGLPTRIRTEFLNESSTPATSGPFGIRAYLADSKLEEDRFVTLGSHRGPSRVDPYEIYIRNMDLAIPSDAPMGFYNLYFQLDSGNHLAEGNEINNYYAKPIIIDVDVDLESEALRVHGDRPDGAGTRPFLTVGQPIDIEYRVRNRDVSSTMSAFREVVWLADSRGQLLQALLASPVHQDVLCSEAGPTSGAIEALDVALSVPLSAGIEPGDYQLVVQTDGFGNLDETDETNNLTVQPIRLIPTTGDRDVIAESLSVPPAGATLNPGEAFEIYFTLENHGIEPVSGPYRERFYLSRDGELDPSQDFLVAVSPIHSETLPGREGETPGRFFGTVTGTVAAGTPLGDYRLLVQVDADNTVPETLEGNNVADLLGLTLGSQGCNEPPAFSGLRAVDWTSGGVQMSWFPASSSCSPAGFDYTLYRATSNSLAALLANPLATELTGLSYTDTSGQPGATYWYLVRATDTVNGLGEENVVRRSVTLPPASGMFFDVSPGGSSQTPVSPGTDVSVSWNIPGATDGVLVGIGGFNGSSGSAVVALDETTTFVLYATVGGVQQVHTATGYVTGSPPQAVSHGPCQEPATTAIDIDGVLHYCRGVRNAQDPQLDKPAVWIPYTVADWELLVGPAGQPWSPYCFSAVGGDGEYAPFRYHLPGTSANEWRTPANVAGLPEIPGDGLDNNCDGSIDE